ncbi:hypothetical protein D3C76_1192590 [compost metagenome]
MTRATPGLSLLPVFGAAVSGQRRLPSFPLDSTDGQDVYVVDDDGLLDVFALLRVSPGDVRALSPGIVRALFSPSASAAALFRAGGAGGRVGAGVTAWRAGSVLSCVCGPNRPNGLLSIPRF